MEKVYKKDENISCRICGVFVEHETQTTDNIGYCIFYKDAERKGECLKIPNGAEKETAIQCETYIRRVEGLDIRGHYDIVVEEQKIAIAKRREAIARRREKIEEQKKEIHERIEYAVRVFGWVLGGLAIIQFYLEVEPRLMNWLVSFWLT